MLWLGGPDCLHENEAPDGVDVKDRWPCEEHGDECGNRDLNPSSCLGKAR